MKALVKNRDQRYASALDFAHELVSAAQSSPQAEGPATIPPSAIMPPSAAEVTGPLVVAKVVQPPKQAPPDSKRDAEVNPQDGLKYAWILPGSFQMGCSPGDAGGRDDEKPRHQVTLTKGFWLGQTVVTVGAYKRFAEGTGKAMPETPRFNPGWSNEQMPMVNVSWDDAQAYCAWAGGRLPTEAEWEYAGRAGSREARYGPLDDVAWYNRNSGGQTHPVGEKRANGFGLYDMLGNVLEWVHDWYDQNYYQNSPAQDPPGPASGQFRVLRGGSGDDDPSNVRLSDRCRGNPANRLDYVGFRCGGKVFGP
jgi:formylglycine-generating enzyme required for sulfatase activity